MEELVKVLDMVLPANVSRNLVDHSAKVNIWSDMYLRFIKLYF